MGGRPFSFEAHGVRVRFAGPSDNAAICELFRSVHLGGALDVTQERDPNFFALPEMHLGAYDVLVAENDTGELVGCGTIIRRTGWLSGKPVETGYLCDLRVSTTIRGGKVMPQAYAAAMEWVRAEYGTELFTTVIFDANERARRALERPTREPESGAKRAMMPSYRPMTPFEMASVQFTLKKPAPAGRVSEASSRDWDELCQFLSLRQKERVLGDKFDEALLRARLSRWPGFALQDFLLARNSAGRIVGCLAPWDTSPFKRTRVLGYHGKMALVHRAFNVAALLGRFPRLPDPGDCFRFSFLTHLEIEGDDPAVFRDLLLAAYRRYDGKGLHFLSSMIPRGSRLNESFRGFMCNRTPMTVYAVHPKDSPFASIDLRTSRPGFEMALS